MENANAAQWLAVADGPEKIEEDFTRVVFSY